jgi:putative transposase
MPMALVGAKAQGGNGLPRSFLFHVDFYKCSLYVLFMESAEKPNWHARGYLPHCDINGLLQHVVLSGKAGIDLTQAELAPIIEETLLFHDGSKYDLQAWCIMPDHIHLGLVFYPNQLMGKMVWTWKKRIATQAKKLPRPMSYIFELDYFDRYVRNLDQAIRLPAYIENNPLKSGLVLDAWDWRWSSAWHRIRGWQPNQAHLPVFLPNSSR